MEKIKDINHLNDWYNSLDDNEKLIASYILGDEDVEYARNEMTVDELLCDGGFETVEDAITEWNSNRISPREKLNVYLIYNGIDFEEESMSEYVNLSNNQNYIFLSNKELADKLNIEDKQIPFIKREWLLENVGKTLEINE